MYKNNNFSLITPGLLFILGLILKSLICFGHYFSPLNQTPISKGEKMNEINWRRDTFWEKYPLLNFIYSLFLFLQKLCNRKAWKTIYERPPHLDQAPFSTYCCKLVFTLSTVQHICHCALWSPTAASKTCIQLNIVHVPYSKVNEPKKPLRQICLDVKRNRAPKTMHSQT